MSRYIDAEWLLRFFEPFGDNYHTPLGVLRACIDDAPSIDIVRCGDCKYCDKDSDRVTGQTVFICQRKNDENLWEKMKADDFCSYGERKDQ